MAHHRVVLGHAVGGAPKGSQDHFATPGKSAPLYVPWIEGRIAGKPVGDGYGAGK